jgi:DNA-directed RNA polymerase specialized sigma24 family protein
MDERPDSVRDLFDAEYGAIVRLATLITGDLAAAEDIAQEVFARALSRWSRIGSYDRPGAWLRRVAIRLAVRDRARRRREFPVAEDVAVASAGPPDLDLIAALQELTANQRAALVLFYFEGLSTVEVAEVLRVRASTARSYLQRGRAALALRLADTEVTTDER